MKIFIATRTLWLTAATVGLIATPACKDAPIGEGANADAHREVLASVADHVIIPLAQQFVASAEELHVAVTAYAGSPTADNLEASRARWIATITSWQQLELLQVGPAGLMGVVAGGESLRDAIYSWPVVNTCRVDQETAREGYADSAALQIALPNVRGLDALEYLLFNDDAGHTCSTGSTFATEGEWEAIGDQAAVVQRRASHAMAVAADLLRSATQLWQAWDPANSGSFRDRFANAGQDTSVYATAQEGLNALSDAMFYVEQETKDMKLAVPAGLIDCAADACPQDRESLYAGLSKEHIVANLEGFRRIFAGGDPDGATVGLDDLLESMGQGELATRLDAELIAAAAAVQDLQGTLLEAVTNAPQSVLAAYDVVRIPIQTFRTEVLSVLDLELPQRAEGDND